MNQKEKQQESWKGEKKKKKDNNKWDREENMMGKMRQN